VTPKNGALLQIFRKIHWIRIPQWSKCHRLHRCTKTFLHQPWSQ